MSFFVQLLYHTYVILIEGHFLSFINMQWRFFGIVD